MSSHSQRNRYQKRIETVVAAIAADPSANHKLEDLAALAHCSPFHFHRVYRSMTGETVAATVRRLRLALAARLMQAQEQSVTDVGFATAYDSPQAFSRAFGQFTGLSPSAFKGQMQGLDRYADETAPGNGTEIGDSATVRLLNRSALQAYAILHHGPLATIPHTQRQLRLHPAASSASEWLGVSFGDPEEAALFRYYAAAVCGEPLVGDGIEALEIPGGCYAVYRLVGPYARIEATFNALYARWLPGSGYEPDDRPSLEVYLNSPREVSPERLCTDLHVPIKAVAA